MNRIELILVAINPLDLHSTSIVVDKNGDIPDILIPEGTQIDTVLGELFTKITKFDISWATPKLIYARNENGVVLTYSCLINTELELSQPYLFDEIRNLDAKQVGLLMLELINKALMQRY